MPTSTAVPPASTMPWRNALARSPPEGRLSRPTARTGARPTLSQAALAKARPRARARSGVSWEPVRPRTSYSRKIERVTFMSLAGGDRSRRLHQAGPAPQHAVDRRRGPEAEENDRRHRRADGDARVAPEAAPRRKLAFTPRRPHVHRHDHRQIVAGGNDAREHQHHRQDHLPLHDHRLEDVPLADEAERAGEAEQREHADAQAERGPGAAAA